MTSLQYYSCYLKHSLWNLLATTLLACPCSSFVFLSSDSALAQEKLEKTTNEDTVESLLAIWKSQRQELSSVKFHYRMVLFNVANDKEVSRDEAR